MELNDFIKAFAELFDDTDASEIKAGTAYHELDEWSSLIGMSVIALVRTHFGKVITGKEMRECNTVEDLYNMIVVK